MKSAQTINKDNRKMVQRIAANNGNMWPTEEKGGPEMKMEEKECDISKIYSKGTFLMWSLKPN